MAVSRRVLLAALGLGGAVVSAGGWLLLRPSGTEALAGLADPEAASRIGRALLAADPAAAEGAGARIAAATESWPADAAPQERRRLVLERVAADFAAGEVTEVEGWILARTEADLAILAAEASGEG